MRSEKRRRIYLSVDQMTYSKLERFAKRNNFKNECEVVSSMVHIMLDRLESADERRFDLPDADGEYIDNMFSEMSSATRQADGDGSVSVTRFVKGGGD